MRLSRTLFWYIFVDLLKVFMMTSGALAGIMSFGGMLKPLMEGGLDAQQVVKILGYLSPAMTAYSFPIATLFACTVVYGRLSADNEIVAARAGGISHFALAVPGLVLGLVIAIWSMLFLCFVVPNFTLNVEKVIYSNIAQIVANQIERNHQLQLDRSANVSIYAQEAHVLPVGQDGEQRLVLVGPMIVRYGNHPTIRRLKVPLEFYTAKQATVYIRQRASDDQVEFSFALDEGMRLPRHAAGQVLAGVGAAQFGPVVREPMIKENTKFMVLDDLKRQYNRPWTSRRVKQTLDEFIGEDQQIAMLKLVEQQLSKTGSLTLSGAGETYVVSAGVGTTVVNTGREMRLRSPDGAPASIRVRQIAGASEPLSVQCNALRFRSWPVPSDDAMTLELSASDGTMTIGNDVTPMQSLDRVLTVPMPPEVKAIERNRARPDLYAGRDASATLNQRILGRELVILRNDILSELNSRAAFALSCLVLAIVGSTMGMIFKSGNFLTAFAICFVPAIVCITLIIAGQRTAGNVSWSYWKDTDSLRIGITLIWSGVVLTFAIGSAILMKLQRT
jgi:lipopolysaccharide export LptBFGC system permease protein LptF